MDPCLSLVAAPRFYWAAWSQGLPLLATHLICTFFHILERSEVSSGLKARLPGFLPGELSLIWFYLLHFPSLLLYGLNLTGAQSPRGCNWSLNKDAFRSLCPGMHTGNKSRKSCFVFQEMNSVPTGRNYPRCSKVWGGGRKTPPRFCSDSEGKLTFLP